jgi:decaprenylphospho-beta-D-erythro-pentofuranosid-2-ulose 2-reductase
MTAGLPEPPLATTPERVAADALAGLRAGAHTVWSPPALRWVMRALRLLPRPVWRRMQV